MTESKFVNFFCGVPIFFNLSNTVVLNADGIFDRLYYKEFITKYDYEVYEYEVISILFGTPEKLKNTSSELSGDFCSDKQILFVKINPLNEVSKDCILDIRNTNRDSQNQKNSMISLV